MAQAQSDALRCNHNTLVGLHWRTGKCQSLQGALAPANSSQEARKTSKKEEPKMTLSRSPRKKGVGLTSPWRVNWNERTRRKRRESETWTKHKTWSWTATSDENHYQEEATITSGAHLKINNDCALVPPHQENFLAQRSDTSCNTLKPNLQNDSTFTSSSLTKKHVFPNVS